MYRILTRYSWGEDETPIECDSKEKAMETVKRMAINEAILSSEEHNCQIGILYEPEKNQVSLYYPYDNTYCYYQIVEVK